MKRLTLKLFTPRNASFTTEYMRLPIGFSVQDGPQLQALLRQFVSQYESAYPGHQFAVREIGKGQYNIVWVAEQAA